MAGKIQLKLPSDFTNPKEWRAYVRQTVPPEEVDFTLAHGRTTLFIRFYEIRPQVLPQEFRTELNRIEGLRDPERTESLVALNGRIFTAMTQLIQRPAEAANHKARLNAAPAIPCGSVEDLLDYLAKNNPNYALWSHYTKQVQQGPDAPSWEEFVEKEFDGADNDEVEFALLMGQLGKLLLHYRDRNAALPPLYFERIWFLHLLRGAEQNLQARAVVQGLAEAIRSCASA